MSAAEAYPFPEATLHIAPFESVGGQYAGLDLERESHLLVRGQQRVGGRCGDGHGATVSRAVRRRQRSGRGYPQKVENFFLTRSRNRAGHPSRILASRT